MQQTCHAQMPDSSKSGESRSSPQVVWERGCIHPSNRWFSKTAKETSRQTRSVRRNGTPTSGNVSGAAKTPSFRKGNKQYTCSGGKHVAEAREWAGNLDLRAENVRKVSLSRQNGYRLDQHAFTDIAFFPDIALESLGEIIRQCFVKLAIPNQSFQN